MVGVAVNPKKSRVVSKIGQTLLALALVVYIVWTLGGSVLKNYQTNQTISQLKSDIAKTNQENINLGNEIIYYQTKTYAELEGRRRLGLKRPDETVLVMPENNDPQTGGSQNSATFSQPTAVDDEPNYHRWYRFILGKGQ